MNIGDVVRSMRSSEQGFITGILPDGQVEVEIEDGFRIPFLKTDLVLVAKEEKGFFGDEEPQAKKSAAKTRSIEKETVVANKGVFFALAAQNDFLYEAFIINNSDLQILLTLGEKSSSDYKGVFAGHLKGKSSQKVHLLDLREMEAWPVLEIQFLSFVKGRSSHREPVVRALKFKNTHFKRIKEDLPQLSRKGYLFQLDEEFAKPVKPSDLKEAIMKPSRKVVTSLGQTKPPKQRSLEVDLHFEEVIKKKGIIPGKEKLELQLEYFEEMLDEGIRMNHEEIIFIHGVGNGTLRAAVQKRLSGHPHIDHFAYARKEKFGYGATAAKVK